MRYSGRNRSTLKDRTALVTGGAKRIGREISLALASRGARIVIQHLPSEKRAALRTAGHIKKDGGRVLLVEADFREDESVDGIFRRTLKATPPPDILINNASVYRASDLRNVSMEDIIETIRVNALAPLELARHMVRGTKKGDIINILDSPEGVPTLTTLPTTYPRTCCVSLRA